MKGFFVFLGRKIHPEINKLACLDLLGGKKVISVNK